MAMTEDELLSNYDLIRKYKDADKEKINSLPAPELHELCEQIIDMHSQIDWNHVNKVRQSKQLINKENVVCPVIPRPPTPYRSWFELSLAIGTRLAKAEYEPKQYAVSYTVHRNYQADWVSPTNPKVVFEAKGVFTSSEETQKYRIVRDQTDLEIIFILQHKNIELPFAKQRKDGSFQTMEQWLDANNFIYTYSDELDEFVMGEAYQHLIATK